MKKMVFINQDVAYLMIDLINAFVEKGYDCVLITGRIVVIKEPLDKRVKIEKIVKYNKTTIANRLFSWIYGFFQIWYKVVFKYRKADLFIVGNPPIAPLLPLVTPNDYYQLGFDLDLHRLLDLGFIKKIRPLGFIWEKIVQKVLSDAKGVFTITDGMAKVLQQHTIGQKVVVMPLWPGYTEVKTIERSQNPFIKKHNLEDKFVVMYSGNLGMSSGVEPLIEVANNTKNKNILFLIVGEGLRKKDLIKKKEEYKLDNCLILPWQEPDILPFSLTSADLAVVSLAGSEAHRSIPSKIFNNLAVGNPILGITSRNSDLASLVEKYKVGKIFEPDEIQGITDFIEALSLNKMEQNNYRSNSREAAKDFTELNTNIIVSAVDKMKSTSAIRNL